MRGVIVVACKLVACQPHADDRAPVVVPIASEPAQARRDAPLRSGGPRVEVRFRDDSVVKAELLDEAIDFATAYGKLRVPVSAIRRLEIVRDEDKGRRDEIETDDLRAVGTVETPALRLRTAQFGEHAVKIAELRAIAPVVERPLPQAIEAVAPPTLSNHEGSPAGTTLRFKVTSDAAGSVYGTGVYTTDSSLASAAVHAGVVQVGETAMIEVELLGQVASFTPSAQNGVTSLEWPSPYPAFRFKRGSSRKR
jgi:hypothetical protein